jgi:diguanylate cyclase (GGDEF)-like protein/PAS domain S-box-containing protein
MKDVSLVQDSFPYMVSPHTFHSALDALSAHISVLDESGKILYVNAGWRDFANDNQLKYENFGIGINYLEICEKAVGDWSQGADEVAAGIRKVLSGEVEAFSVGYPCHGPRKQRWFDMRAVPLKNSSGIGAIIFHEDVTERKQIEESLIERDLKYQAIFENAADGIFLMQGERFVDCNPSTLTMFACTREQIINQSLYKFSPQNQPDGRNSKEKALEYIDAALAGKSQRFEWTHLKADGTPFEAEVRLTRVDLYDRMHILASVRDISEQKKIEYERKLNESRLNSLLELSQKAHTLSEHDIVQHALETAVKLTNSEIGYLHFVNPDQNTIELVTWSEKTYEYCTIVSEKHYPLADAGVWADCVRIKKPVIHNDYQAIPDKKGYPEGHAHLVRHTSIPVYDREKIALILGVGNKLKDYDSSDIAQIQLIGDQLIRILQRKRFEEDLRVKDGAIASSINAVAIADLDGNLSYVNAAFLRMWGYACESEVLGRSLVNFWKYPETAANVVVALKEQGSWMGELAAIRKNGVPFNGQLSASLIRDDKGEPISMMGSFIDISERMDAEKGLLEANMELANRLAEIEKLQAQLREQAIRDSLTGLFNRRYLEENMAQAIARADRYKYPISLVMIDIDHFKIVNDTYGHKAGDEMLIALSNLLRNHIRKGDTICRYGGEEFVVMMPRASWKSAVERADQWRVAFENLKVTFEDHQINTTLSAGIATLSPDNNNIENAMREADIALYRSKSEGRNCVTVSEKFRA